MYAQSYLTDDNKKIALEGVIRELRELLNKTIFEDLLCGGIYRQGSWTLWLVHYVYEAIPINFYIHYTPLLLCLRSLMSFPSLSPHSFSFIFFLSSFYLNHQLFLAQHNGHYLCLNDLSSGMKRRKTFNRPSSRLLVDILLCCTFMLLCIAYPFLPLKLLISPP